MTARIELSGECQQITLKLYREKSGKYSVLAELGAADGSPVDKQQITESRSLTYAVQELVDAAYSLEVAVNRSKISLKP